MAGYLGSQRSAKRSRACSAAARVGAPQIARKAASTARRSFHGTYLRLFRTLCTIQGCTWGPRSRRRPPYLFLAYPHRAPRRAEGSRRYLDRVQYGSKHGARLRPEKSLCGGRPVRTREEKGVDGRQTCPFPGMVKASQLVVAQREVPITPFHIGAGALEHRRQRGCLRLQLVLLHRAYRLQCPTGRKQRCPEALGKLTKRLALCHGLGRGHTLKGIRRNQRGVHGVGRGWRQVQLTHLLAHISRDELDGDLHCGHHALGFPETLQTGLAELFVLGNGTDRVDVALDIPGNERPIATHAARQVDKVVGVAN